MLSVFETDSACRWQRREQHSARFQNSVALAERRSHVVDDVEGLGEDDAVEPLRWKLGRRAQVRHHRGTFVGRVEIQDRMLRYPWPAEREREVVFLHFEDGAAHVGGVGGQEFLDVSPVDRDSTVVTPIAADRIGPPEITPIQRVAAVVPYIRPVVRGLDPQPIQFLEIRVATRRKLAMHIAQSSKADLTGHEHFGHVAQDGWAVPFDTVRNS